MLAVYDKQLTQQAQRAALGKRPLDCWRDVARLLGLEGRVSAEQLVAESEPLLSARWVCGEGWRGSWLSVFKTLAAHPRDH